MNNKRKTKERFLVLIIITIMVCCLAACSNSEPKSDPSSGTKSEKENESTQKLTSSVEKTEQTTKNPKPTTIKISDTSNDAPPEPTVTSKSTSTPVPTPTSTPIPTPTSIPTEVPMIENPISDDEDGMMKVGGKTVNKLPYTSNGLTITEISFDSWSATVTVKNETGYAIRSTSSISYKCFDKNGTVVSSGNMYLEDINNGELCNGTVIVDNNVVKIVFDSASVKLGNEKEDKDTTVISGKEVNKLPYTTNGLTITAISFDSWSATVTVKNETGYAIKSTSSIAYKCFDKKGTVVSSGNMYLEDINKGESCNATVIVDSSVAKIVFDEGSVKQGSEKEDKDTTVISGKEVNKLPYTTNGLTITAISFDFWSATVTVKNETGHAIKSTSSIAYKCFDKSGTVVSSGNMYLEDLNKGETCNGTVIVDSSVVKILFDAGSVKEGTEKAEKETITISGREVNKLPYSANGLTVTAISFDSWSATVTVKNETGHAIKSTSSIAYKCFDKNGTVVSSGNMYLEDLNKGEACNGTIIADSNVVKILFDEGSVKEGTERAEKETVKISGRTVNKLPYTTNGLTIKEISFDSWSATVTVKNETGSAIKSTSSISYKCYDSNGTVFSSGNMYLEDVNNGESCTGTIIVDSNITKIVFFDGSVRQK